MFESIKKIIKLKDNFSNLSFKRIEDIYRTINNTGKIKPCINITTKGPLYKQIIIPMRGNNIKNFMKTSGKYIANLNHSLKGIKLDTIVDFIYSNH